MQITIKNHSTSNMNLSCHASGSNVAVILGCYASNCAGEDVTVSFDSAQVCDATIGDSKWLAFIMPILHPNKEA